MDAIDPKTKRLYEFGSFRLDPEEEVLYHDSKPVFLIPNVFEMLLVLVENRGRILSKDTLLNKLWQDSYVEEPNLTVTMSHVRKSLGQMETGEQFIETLPRRGYRFNASMREVWLEEAALLVEEYTSSRLMIEDKESSDCL